MPRASEYRFHTGDVVRAKGHVFGRVEEWSGRDLVLVRVTDVPPAMMLPMVGMIVAYASDELALVKTFEGDPTYFRGYFTDPDVR